MATRLTNLIIDRVDLVDQGANPEAFITLWKRASEPSKPVSISHAIAKVGTRRLGRTSLQKGTVPHVVIEKPDDPAEWVKALPKLCSLADDGLQVSGDEATVRALLALMPTTFERHAMLSAPGLEQFGRGPAVLRRGVDLADWSRKWQRVAEVQKAREAREAPVDEPTEDDAVAAFERAIEAAGKAVQARELSAEERNVLAMRGQSTPYAAAITVAQMRNPAAALAWADRR